MIIEFNKNLFAEGEKLKGIPHDHLSLRELAQLYAYLLATTGNTSFSRDVLDSIDKREGKMLDDIADLSNQVSTEQESLFHDSVY
jgi:hypothetical protein